jgi:hypothetical protein
VWIIDLASFHVFFPTRAGGGSSLGQTATSVHTSNIDAGGSVRGSLSSYDASQGSYATVGSGIRPPDAAVNMINISPFDLRSPLVQFLPQRRQLALDNSFNTNSGKSFHRAGGRPRAVELLGSDSEVGEIDIDLESEEVRRLMWYAKVMVFSAHSKRPLSQARKVICDFIAKNLATRKVWYERDDSEVGLKCISREVARH